MTEPNTELDIKLLLPGALWRFELPGAVARRLEWLLDKQDRGEELTDDERAEAEGLVDIVDMLSLLRLRASNVREAEGH